LRYELLKTIILADARRNADDEEIFSFVCGSLHSRITMEDRIAHTYDRKFR